MSNPPDDLTGCLALALLAMAFVVGFAWGIVLPVVGLLYLLGWLR